MGEQTRPQTFDDEADLLPPQTTVSRYRVVGPGRTAEVDVFEDERGRLIVEVDRVGARHIRPPKGSLVYVIQLAQKHGVFWAEYSPSEWRVPVTEPRGLPAHVQAVGDPTWDFAVGAYRRGLALALKCAMMSATLPEAIRHIERVLSKTTNNNPQGDQG